MNIEYMRDRTGRVKQYRFEVETKMKVIYGLYNGDADGLRELQFLPQDLDNIASVQRLRSVHVVLGVHVVVSCERRGRRSSAVLA